MAEPEVVRWYTHARRFPLLVGRASLNGGRLPGGPYRVSQVVTFVAGVIVLKLTWALWAHAGFITNAAVLLVLPLLVAFAVGKLPANGRNPIYAMYGAIRWVTAPSLGSYAGRPLRLRRPCRVRHRVVLAPDPAWRPRPTSPRPPTEPTKPGPARLSGKQRLLAAPTR